MGNSSKKMDMSNTPPDGRSRKKIDRTKNMPPLKTSFTPVDKNGTSASKSDPNTIMIPLKDDSKDSEDKNKADDETKPSEASKEATKVVETKEDALAPIVDAKASNGESKTSTEEHQVLKSESTSESKIESHKNATVVESKNNAEESKHAAADMKLDVVESKAVVQDEKSVVKETNAVSEESKPMVEESKAVTEDIKMIAEENKSAVEGTKTVVEDNKTVVEHTKIVEDNKTVDEENKMVVEESKTVVKESKKIVEETKSDAVISSSVTKEVVITEEVIKMNEGLSEVVFEKMHVTSSSAAVHEESNAAAKVSAAKMPIDMYYLPPSPPCRAVLLTARMLGVDLNLKVCNVLEGEHKKPEFMKMNPQHTIPTMNDNGFILWESRPIMTYLVNQYSKNDSLYPKDPKERAVVDQRLFFDMGTLYQRMGDYYFPLVFYGQALDPSKLPPLQEAAGFLDTLLQGNSFSAGDHLTLADIALTVTVSNMEAFEFDFSPYSNILAWFTRCKEALAAHGYEEINQAGVNIMASFYKTKSAMGLDFYYLPGSAPCRSVLLTAKALGVELNLKMTNLMAGEHMTPEFLKMNPQHTVPTLNDNGFCLWESRAICSYLVNKYGKDDQLYPKDAKARAVVDQRLYFDMGTLYQRFGDYFYPVIFGGASFDAEKKKKMEEALQFLDKFLAGQTWAAGPNMTIADFALVASISTLDAVEIDLTPYSNILSWYDRVKSSAVDYQEANGEGAMAFKAMADSMLKKWERRRSNSRSPASKKSNL